MGKSAMLASMCTTYDEYEALYTKYYNEEVDSDGNESTRKSEEGTCKDSKEK